MCIIHSSRTIHEWASRRWNALEALLLISFGVNLGRKPYGGPPFLVYESSSRKTISVYDTLGPLDCENTFSTSLIEVAEILGVICAM
jgi:hypothetical protein